MEIPPEIGAEAEALLLRSALDAGAGNGVFLPLMADLLGADGHIEALDLAEENVEAIESLIAGQS